VVCSSKGASYEKDEGGRGADRLTMSGRGAGEGEGEPVCDRRTVKRTCLVTDRVCMQVPVQYRYSTGTGK